EPVANTIGMVEVMLFAASTSTLPGAAITSTLRSTNSEKNAGRRSFRRNALLLEKLAHQPQRRPAVAPAPRQQGLGWATERLGASANTWARSRRNSAMRARM